MIKLLILDEQKIYKEGLISCLNHEKNIHILESSQTTNNELEKLFTLSPELLIKKICAIQPDIVLIDPFYKKKIEYLS